jgi:hypothetical protein
MQFLKKHYEKIILSVVLLGLVGVLVAMWFVIMADKQKMEDLKNNLVHGKPTPLAPLDLGRYDGILARLKQPYQLDFSATNKLFNPVQWRRGSDGKMIKLTTGRELGPGAAVVSKITPLYYAISLGVVETNGIVPRYKIILEHQAAAVPAQRRAQPHYASVGEKVNGLFTLLSITGPAEDPTTLTLKLANGQTVTVGKDKPYRTPEGYSADIKYEPEKINATNQRVGDTLNFAGDQYNIIAIEQNDVILLANSNQKRYTLVYRQ